MNNQNTSIVLTIPELINIVTTVNLVIMFCILFFRKQNTIPNKILAFILLLPALNYINNYLILSNHLSGFPSIVFLSQAGALVCTVLIFQYTQIFMGRKFNPFNVLNILTSVAVLFCLFHYFRYLMFDAGGKDRFVEDILNEKYPSFLTYCRGAFFWLLNAYFLVIAFQTWKYSTRILNIKSDLEQLKLRYLQRFVILIWSLNIGILVSYVIWPNFYVDFIAVPIITNIFYIFLLMTGFNYAAIFTINEFHSFEKQLEIVGNIDISKTASKEFEKEEEERIHSRLDHLLYQDKIFTDPEITIVKFAEALGLTLHQTSFFINQYLNTNFYNLINSRRIELAKEKMKTRGKDSEIEVIGYESGFNSKSAFYRAFSKYVQMSPSEYINRL